MNYPEIRLGYLTQLFASGGKEEPNCAWGFYGEPLATIPKYVIIEKVTIYGMSKTAIPFPRDPTEQSKLWKIGRSFKQPFAVVKCFPFCLVSKDRRLKLIWTSKKEKLISHFYTITKYQSSMSTSCREGNILLKEEHLQKEDKLSSN